MFNDLDKEDLTSKDTLDFILVNILMESKSIDKLNADYMFEFFKKPETESEPEEEEIQQK